MSITSNAHTTWNGTLTEGEGTVTLGSSGAAVLPVNWKARSAGSESVTTPEELIAAAHASCYAMALSHALTGNGTPPTQLRTAANVTFVPGTGITTSALSVEAVVPSIDEAAFLAIANEAKAGCPVSQALAGVDITLNAALVQE